ncbi:MAG TPA: DNA polymerase domain-containing protein [Microthrixaceae bacterium]|nr:DNA polymerase domain-containing protein [Microthrixaceae bacterium]
MARTSEIIEVDGREVPVSNPGKIFFPSTGLTKLGLIEHYLLVGSGALRGVKSRPTVLKRFPNGAEGDFFFQKRVPEKRPEWLETVTIAFPSGRTALELCPADLAHIVWAVNLGCIDLNPWPVRRWDTDHPDELRVDLDPMPGVEFDTVRKVALAVNDVLVEHGLIGWPKTSGSRGIHIVIRIHQLWDFTEVRRAALALAREVERRMPDLATTKWWKEERGERVLIDFNQNARDRTVASAYSVRPTPDAWVSAPVRWSEVPDVELGDFSVASMPQRWKDVGDLEAGDPENGVLGLDESAGSLRSLLDLAERDEAGGLGDAPWPPNFPKMPGEGRRVSPSRRAADADDEPAAD